MEGLLRLELRKGGFVERPNRFTVKVSTPEGTVLLHNRNTGRLGELLRPGAVLYYMEGGRSGAKKTSGVLVGVAVTGEEAALTDPHLQARSFEVAWERGLIEWLKGWTMIKKEVRYGGVRFDYAISSSSGTTGYLELKSAVFHDGSGYCMYPDVPSERGRRHLKVLEAIASRGIRTVIAFVAAHPLCRGFKPCASCDPAFATQLREAKEKGVEVRAVGMALRADGLTYLISGDLPVSLT